jgi:hypothetical protein
VDWSPRTQLLFSTQFFQRIVLSRQSRISGDRIENFVLLFFRGDFRNDTLTPQLFVLSGLDDWDYWLQGSLRYAVDDNLSVKVGADLFAGTSSGSFGQFHNNDRIYLVVEYCFGL